MSKEVTFDDFLLLFKIAVEKHKNTNDPIPELNLSKTGKIRGCLQSPFQSYGGVDLYPTIYDKASKLFYEINKGHNLSNGNKRMAYVVTEYFLFINNIILDISDDKIYELSLNVATSHSDNQQETIKYIKNTLRKSNKMTKKDYEAKIAAANSNKALNDKQREQIVAMYTKKIAELEPEKKAPEKAPAKKEVVKKSAPGKSEPKKETPAKAAPKKSDPYDCDELIAKAEKSRAAAKERAAAPKKTEVTKSKEKIEKVHDTVQKNVEAGKFGKAQLQKLITETEELLTFLKKTLKSL